MSAKASQRIGIYAGTFDPIHAGHIAFALQAKEAASLDKLYFLPERGPRGKQGVSHFGHRVAMLERAIKPYKHFGVMELVDVSFSVKRTLPELQKRFRGSQLVFLFGSDIAVQIPTWSHSKQFLKVAEIVIGLREEDDEDQLRQALSTWTVRPTALTLFRSHAPSVSSGRIRDALRRRRKAAGVLKSVERYSDKHWLYVSLGD